MSQSNDALYGIPVKEIARICGVDLATARRWKRGATCPPQSALMVLSRDLGVLDPEWRGWTLQEGKLVSPENWAVSPGDVLSFQLLRSQLAIYQAENKRLRAEYSEYEEQPRPETWVINMK